MSTSGHGISMTIPAILGTMLTLSFSLPAQAAQINAATCSKADVTTAVNSAADGDTVRIPAGSCAWTGALSTAKGISIIGAGEGVTTITGGGFDFTTPSGKGFRASGMTIKGTAGVGVYSSSKSWRVDHITFDTVTGRPSSRIVWIEPVSGQSSAGVIDHVTFRNPQSIQVHYRGSQADGGNGEWMRPLGLGGSDAVYIEDSTFSHATLEVSSPVTDCDGGGRLVFRRNTVSNAYFEMHDAIIGGLRGCRRWEVYDNTFTKTYNSGQCTYIGIRGGTGVVFNNTFVNPTDCDKGIQIVNYRTYQTGGSPWGALCRNTTGKACLNSLTKGPASCTSDANCGGVAGSCIAIDGPISAPSGYPCRDQIGTTGNSPQTSQPALFWNNLLDGVPVTTIDVTGGSYVGINRDFCVSATTKPASCNGITTTYTPYVYPHPLTSGGGGGAPPAAPTNLVVK